MKTYCNPLPVKDIPPARFLNRTPEQRKEDPDFRSIADPSVVYHDGKWIMYPSYALAYVSEDFVNWDKVDIGIEHLSYSPAVVEFRGKWYLSGHSMSELYVSDSPLGPFDVVGHFTDINGKLYFPADACFLADGDRLYLYFHMGVDDYDEDLEGCTCTGGVELDPDKPWQFITDIHIINRFDANIFWHRKGEHHQNARMGWIEGQWVKKIGSRYYLLYSGNATAYSSYANGVAYSDEGPLAAFVPQKKHDPLTYKTSGIVKGPGHGCLVDGPCGTLWVFYTTVFNFLDPCERRIGMDPVGIDENGELYCPAVTETPQFAPGVLKNPEKGNSTDLLPLNLNDRPTASSCLVGREALYATDDSVLTWWQPSSYDQEPTLTCRIGNLTSYGISAIRLLWRDIGMDSDNGILPGPFKYVVEYSPTSDLNEWEILVDASDNEYDLSVDYRECEAKEAYGIRLRILGAPEGITPAVVNFTAFGKYNKNGRRMNKR